MFRSVIELCNKARNVKLSEKMRAQMNAGWSSDPCGRGYLSTLDQHSNIFDNVCNDSTSIDLESKLSPSLFSDEEFNCDDTTKPEVNCNPLPERIPINKTATTQCQSK